MPTTYATAGYIELTGLTIFPPAGGPSSTLTWSNFNGFNNDFNIVDNDDNGQISTSGDYFFTSSYNFSGYTIDVGGVTYPVFFGAGSYLVPLPVNGIGQTIIPTSGTSNSYVTETTGDVFLCFASGTQIATPGGETSVEELRIGDMVTTASGKDVPVKWIGRQTIDKYYAGERAQLVKIEEGTLGNHSDLYVTADHGMILDGCVVNASALVNGDTVNWVSYDDTPWRQTVYHVETEDHDVIIANGALSETYLDIPGRRTFDNFAEYVELYGEEREIPESKLPRVSSARLLPTSIKTRLLRQAA